MTEADWLSSSDPGSMLRHVRDGGLVSQRKLRLFAVACCRRVWHRLTDPRSRRAVEVAERYADGQATTEQLASAGAWDVYLETSDAEYYAALAGYYAVNDPDSPSADDVADALVRSSYLDPDDLELEEPALADLCREVFGNLFRPTPVTHARWLTPDVVSLAGTIYAERAWTQMPALASALAEAGCDREDFLAHVRSPGAHVRGCWVLDAILAKS